MIAYFIIISTIITWLLHEIETFEWQSKAKGALITFNVYTPKEEYKTCSGVYIAFSCFETWKNSFHRYEYILFLCICSSASICSVISFILFNSVSYLLFSEIIIICIAGGQLDSWRFFYYVRLWYLIQWTIHYVSIKNIVGTLCFCGSWTQSHHSMQCNFSI